MSVNKYVNGKLLQLSGNADTRLTSDDIATILGYTPVNPNIIGTELATLNSSGKLEDSQKPSYSWSEITGKPAEFTPESHTHNYAGSSSSGGAATAALALTTARTLTIGNSGKTFDGSEDVSWTLGEIGAASQSDLDSQGERITTNETSINELNGAVESISNPEYDVSTQTEVEDLVSGEGLPVAIKKLAKAVSDYISHKADATSHVTSTERATWNAKLGTSDVVNNVTSTDTSKPLSANMGKELQDQITTNTNAINTVIEGNEIITGTLTAGETTITISNDRITNNSILSFYTSIYGVNPTSVTVNDGSVTLEFKAQTENMEVGVRIFG